MQPMNLSAGETVAGMEDEAFSNKAGPFRGGSQKLAGHLLQIESTGFFIWVFCPSVEGRVQSRYNRRSYCRKP
jgi:hypothetical protein